MDYQFSYDEGRKLVTIVQNGYWSMETFQAFKLEFLALHRKAFVRNKDYRVLADCSQFKVQSNEVGLGFTEVFEHVMREYRGRYAIIAGSTMNKMQARRFLPYRQMEVFGQDERDRAIDWLFNDDDTESGGAVH